MDLERLKLTLSINSYSLLKIPLLAFVTPVVIESSANRSVVQVRLDWRSRNHLGVMYFGALAMGAELSIALKAIAAIAEKTKQTKQPISFIFKDFQCEFLKRADHHVHFCCDEAAGVADLVEKASLTPERVEQTFAGYAFVPKNSTDPVMRYKLTLSLKRKSRASAD